MATAATDRVAIPQLARWGFSADADLVYRMLALGGPLTAASAAQELGLAPGRVATALDELAARGAVRPVVRRTPASTRPRGRVWLPAPVETVLNAARRAHQIHTGTGERWRRHLATVTGATALALDDHSVRRLTTRSLARERIAELVAVERREHLAINTEQAFSADAAAAASPLDRQILARGIPMRLLGRPPGDGDQSCAHAVELTESGAEYREAGTLPLKLMVFDRRVAVFPADPTDLEAGAVEIMAEPAVEHLVQVFYRAWAAARDPRRKGVPAIVLTSREKALIALLTQGHSDQQAAAALGVSRRTVIYTLRALMDRVGVENRFQLALVLGATHATPLPAPYTDKDNLCAPD